MKNAFNAKEELLNLSECSYWRFYDEETNGILLLEYDKEGKSLRMQSAFLLGTSLRPMQNISFTRN